MGLTIRCEVFEIPHPVRDPLLHRRPPVIRLAADKKRVGDGLSVALLRGQENTIIKRHALAKHRSVDSVCEKI